MMIDITQILGQIDEGDPHAANHLLPLIYDELRRLAAARMASERSDHTLQATALVHEAYARLVGSSNDTSWENRGHFFSAAAESMRRILVETARAKKAQKRSAPQNQLAMTNISVEPHIPIEDFLDLHHALEQLEQEDERLSRIVKLRYFTGLTIAETALCLGISEATVIRDWRYARAWLQRKMQPEG
ncbi:sigma-70 family RNA polymerase sigma factor [Symmachiella dynata]|jgi:RNA polymerase sigma factor (TIGR02999 family)|uniref:sigma-70 family RNA polymerase sigma factor n=1 Tax=Symmachiella dynata TaxID=2527995 RepID=UPI0030EBECAE